MLLCADCAGGQANPLKQSQEIDIRLISFRIRTTARRKSNQAGEKMPDLLVRGLDADVYERIKQAAERERKSLSQTAREALSQKFKPSKEKIWAEIDRFRESIGPISTDSTVDIREWRDNDEPYR
jgi:antitoxin FitA